MPKNSSAYQGWQESLQHYPKSTSHIGIREEHFVGDPLSLVYVGYKMEGG